MFYPIVDIKFYVEQKSGIPARVGGFLVTNTTNIAI